MRGRRGSILVLCYFLAAFLMAFGSVLVMRSFTDQRVAHRHRDQLHAFQVAEAGIDDALIQLRNNFNTASVPSTSFSTEQSYQATITPDGDVRTVRSTGTSTEESTASKQLEIKVQRSIPDNFYDNAIYGSGEVTLNGNAYSIVGNVLTGDDELINNIRNVTGQVIYDSGAKPLPKLSFSQLKTVATDQGNFYDAARLESVKQGLDSFPLVFCYSPPTNPNDLSTCAPNINYLTADLVLSGNVGTIGGFFVVVGNVLTDPSATQNTTINGTGQVEGMIYTTGEFTVNGGGGGLNLVGGVWVGEGVKINGNVAIQYNADYMKAVENLGLNADLRLLYWQDCPPSGCT